MKNQEYLSDGKRGPKKPMPMSWVIIAILAYLLFQVCYLAFKPLGTVSMSYKYDRSLIKPESSPQSAAQPRPSNQSRSPSTPPR